MEKNKPPGTSRAIILAREIQDELVLLREADGTCDRSWSRILELTEELTALMEEDETSPAAAATPWQQDVFSIGREIAVAVAVELIRVMVTRTCTQPRTTRREIDRGPGQPWRGNSAVPSRRWVIAEGTRRAA